MAEHWSAGWLFKVVGTEEQLGVWQLIFLMAYLKANGAIEEIVLGYFAR